MQKICSHIKNPGKFGKASKLAIQLIQAGSVKPGTSDHFFAILEAAMSSSTACTDPLLRSDYHALFSAAQDATEVRLWSFLNTRTCFYISYQFVFLIGYISYQLLEENILLEDYLTFCADCSASIRSKRIN